MPVKYSKWPLNTSTLSNLGPSKIYPNWDFWFEKKPSGNPGHTYNLPLRKKCPYKVSEKRIVSIKKCEGLQQSFSISHPNIIFPFFSSGANPTTSEFTATTLIFYKCRSWQLHKAFFLAFFCKKTFNFEITIF
jgi:hypothetical protein